MYSPSYLYTAMDPQSSTLLHTIFTSVTGTFGCCQHSLSYAVGAMKSAFRVSLDKNSPITSAALNVMSTLSLPNKLKQDMRYFNIFMEFVLTVKFNPELISPSDLKSQIFNLIYNDIPDKCEVSILHEFQGEIFFCIEYAMTDSLIANVGSRRYARLYRNATEGPFTWYVPMSCLPFNSTAHRQQWVASLQKYSYFSEICSGISLSVETYKQVIKNNNDRAALFVLTYRTEAAESLVWAFLATKIRPKIRNIVVARTLTKGTHSRVRLTSGALKSKIDAKASESFLNYINTRLADKVEQQGMLLNIDSVKSWFDSLKKITAPVEKVKNLFRTGRTVYTSQESVRGFYLRCQDFSKLLNNIDFNSSDTSTSIPDNLIAGKVAVYTTLPLIYSENIHLPDIYAWCIEAFGDIPFYVDISTSTSETQQFFIEVDIVTIVPSAWVLQGPINNSRLSVQTTAVHDIAKAVLGTAQNRYTNYLKLTRHSPKSSARVNKAWESRAFEHNQLVSSWECLAMNHGYTLG